MKIRALKLYDHDFGNDWTEQVEDHWNYNQFLADVAWRRKWISIDGVVHHPGNDVVYCGITSFDADIFKAWNRKTETWQDLGFKEAGNAYDAKFHRSMELSPDGRYLYAATALLHDIDRYFDAPGGGIYRFDTQAGKVEKLGVPLPHIYIQSIVLDATRNALYCMHFTPERLSRFDLTEHTARDLGPLSSGMIMAQGENVILDDAGNAWCGWHVTRAWQSNAGVDSHRLCTYLPGEDRIQYHDWGLPRPDGAHGFAKVEGLFNLGHGLHASGANGSLYRIDAPTGKAGKAVYLGTPIANRPSRLTSLTMHTDGYAYGVTGRAGECRLLQFDPKRDTYELGDPIADGDTAMFQCHDVTITPDGVLYAGENDHPRRSGYLWEIKL